MKALSLTPWWAWIVARGLKPVENRRWPTKFRGEFAIHASLGKPAHRVEVCDFIDQAPIRMQMDLDALDYDLPGDEVPRGGIIAVAKLVDCVTSHPSPWFFGPYGFVLENVLPVDFTPCKGALGFWQVPKDVEAALMRALGRAT